MEKDGTIEDSIKETIRFMTDKAEKPRRDKAKQKMVSVYKNKKTKEYYRQHPFYELFLFIHFLQDQ